MVRKPSDAPSASSSSRGVFVTVGTTRFDALIAEVAGAPFCERLAALGFEWLRLQVGRGDAPAALGDAEDEERRIGGLRVSWFRFTPTLPAEMARARVVVSHAGAGSVLEALELDRRTVVVVNDALMDNHQAELADALERDAYLVVARNPRAAAAAVAEAAAAAPAPFPPPDPTAFPALVDEEMAKMPRLEIPLVLAALAAWALIL